MNSAPSQDRTDLLPAAQMWRQGIVLTQAPQVDDAPHSSTLGGTGEVLGADAVLLLESPFRTHGVDQVEGGGDALKSLLQARVVQNITGHNLGAVGGRAAKMLGASRQATHWQSGLLQAVEQPTPYVACSAGDQYRRFVSDGHDFIEVGVDPPAAEYVRNSPNRNAMGSIRRVF